MNNHVGSMHQPFYEHLTNGGKVWRRDPLNRINEVLSAKSFMGECNKITKFGYKDLMVIPMECEKYFYDFIED
jgi:hypothetical protein